MYKVFKITWAGLKLHVATFKHEHEAKKFVEDHSNYTLEIERGF
jgi:hypothetical protein